MAGNNLLLVRSNCLLNSPGARTLGQSMDRADHRSRKNRADSAN